MGLWHLPIWFTTGFTGINLIKYITFFMITIISVSIIITAFYNLNKNLLVSIMIHQLFNFFIGIISWDLIELIKYYAILYLLVAIILVIMNPRKVLQTRKQGIMYYHKELQGMLQDIENNLYNINSIKVKE